MPLNTVVNIRKIVIGAVVVVIGLPVALVLIAAATFYVLLYVPNQTNGTLVSSGQEREYLLYVPRSYDRAKPTPLVISMHAATLGPGAQMETSHWNKVADQHGFIVVYPSAPGFAPLPFLPSLPVWLLRPEAELSANVRFISDLIDALEAAYNIDRARIYANGFSNGGAMAFALSCRLSDRIAAVGTVSAAQDQRPWSWCADTRPVPLINFHGTADLVPYHGGQVWVSPTPFPSVSTWTANWARRNRCGSDPIETVVAADVTRLEYTNCADDAAVVLYTIRGGGHAWPGGKPLPEWMVGPTTRSIDATSQMWAFFREHQLREHR